MRDGFQELTMGAFEPVAFVEPNLASGRDPMHAFVRIVVEQERSFARDPSR